MSTIKRTEYTRNGRRVILDTCELAANRYETMLMYPDGQEITYRTASTETDALRDFEVILAAYPADKKPEAPKPLTGKYAKLRDDLIKARAIALDAAALVEDGGTCNLDAPSLLLPRWQSAKVKQACEEAGGDYFRWGYSNRYVICLRLPGQAYKRETAAEAMTKALADMGYDALTYCAMD